MINETNNLDQTAIIDCRGPNPGAFHDAYRAFAVRARLDREHGTHANQLIWEGPTHDRRRHGLRAEQLHRDGPLAQPRSRRTAAPDAGAEDHPRQAVGPHRRVLRAAPATKLSNDLCGRRRQRSTARRARSPATRSPPTPTSASSSRSTAPTTRPSRSRDAEWTTLQPTFPDGVCDYSKPGVDQQATIPWLTYQDAHGHGHLRRPSAWDGAHLHGVPHTVGAPEATGIASDTALYR